MTNYQRPRKSLLRLLDPEEEVNSDQLEDEIEKLLDKRNTRHRSQEMTRLFDAPLRPSHFRKSVIARCFQVIHSSTPLPRKRMPNRFTSEISSISSGTEYEEDNNQPRKPANILGDVIVIDSSSSQSKSIQQDAPISRRSNIMPPSSSKRARESGDSGLNSSDQENKKNNARNNKKSNDVAQNAPKKSAVDDDFPMPPPRSKKKLKMLQQREASKTEAATDRKLTRTNSPEMVPPTDTPAEPLDPKSASKEDAEASQKLKVSLTRLTEEDGSSPRRTRSGLLRRSASSDIDGREQHGRSFVTKRTPQKKRDGGGASKCARRSKSDDRAAGADSKAEAGEIRESKKDPEQEEPQQVVRSGHKSPRNKKDTSRICRGHLIFDNATQSGTESGTSKKPEDVSAANKDVEDGAGSAAEEEGLHMEATTEKNDSNEKEESVLNKEVEAPLKTVNEDRETSGGLVDEVQDREVEVEKIRGKSRERSLCRSDVMSDSRGAHQNDESAHGEDRSVDGGAKENGWPENRDPPERNDNLGQDLQGNAGETRKSSSILSRGGTPGKTRKSVTFHQEIVFKPSSPPRFTIGKPPTLACAPEEKPYGSSEADEEPNSPRTTEVVHNPVEQSPVSKKQEIPESAHKEIEVEQSPAFKKQDVPEFAHGEVEVEDLEPEKTQEGPKSRSGEFQAKEKGERCPTDEGKLRKPLADPEDNPDPVYRRKTRLHHVIESSSDLSEDRHIATRNMVSRKINELDTSESDLEDRRRHGKREKEKQRKTAEKRYVSKARYDSESSFSSELEPVRRLRALVRPKNDLLRKTKSYNCASGKNGFRGLHEKKAAPRSQKEKWNKRFDKLLRNQRSDSDLDEEEYRQAKLFIKKLRARKAERLKQKRIADKDDGRRRHPEQLQSDSSVLEHEVDRVLNERRCRKIGKDAIYDEDRLLIRERDTSSCEDHEDDVGPRQVPAGLPPPKKVNGGTIHLISNEAVDVSAPPLNKKIDVVTSPLNLEANVEVATSPTNVQANVEVATSPLNLDANIDVATTPLNPKVDVATSPLNLEANVEVATSPTNIQANVEVATSPLNLEANVEVATSPTNSQATVEVAAPPLNKKIDVATTPLNQKVDVATSPLNLEANVEVATSHINIQANVVVATSRDPNANVDVAASAPKSVANVDGTATASNREANLDVATEANAGIAAHPLTSEANVGVAATPSNLEANLDVATEANVGVAATPSSLEANRDVATEANAGVAAHSTTSRENDDRDFPEGCQNEEDLAMALEILSVRISSQGPNPKRDRLHRWMGCFRKDEPSRFVIRIRLSVRLFNGGQSSALAAPRKGAQRRKSGPRSFNPQGRLQGSWRRKGSLSTTSSNEGSSSFNSRALDMFYCNDSEFHREAKKRWATPKLFETVAMESTSDALRFSSSSEEDEEDGETDRDRTLSNKSRKSGRWRVDDYAVAVPTSDDVTTDLLLKTVNLPLPPGCQKEVGRRSDHDDGSDSSSFLPSQFGESPTFSEVVPKKISLTPFRPPSLKRNMKNGKTKVYHKKKLFAAAKKRRSDSRGASTSALSSSLENRPSPSKTRVSSGYLGSATPEHATGESQTSRVASPLKSRPSSSKKRVSWGYVRSTTPEQPSGVVSPLENRPSPAKKRDSSGNVGPATPEDVTGQSLVSRDVSPLKSRPNPSRKRVSSGDLGPATPDQVIGQSQVSKDVSPLKNQPSPSKKRVRSGNLGSATFERVTGESRVSRVASPLKNRPSSSKKSVNSGSVGSATPNNVAGESEPLRVASPLKNGPSSSKRRGVSWARARSTTPAPSTSAKDSARKRKSGGDANSGGESGQSSVNGVVVLEDGQKRQQEEQENHLSISRKLNFVTDEQDGTRGRSRGRLNSPLATPLPAIQECEDQAQVSQPSEQVENSTISTKKKAKRRTRLTEPKPKARNSKRSASITRDSNSMPDDTMNTTGLRRSGRERRPPKPEVYRCFIVVNSARRLKSFNHELGINEADEVGTLSLQNASSVTNRASVSRASTATTGRKRSQTVADPDNLATPPANKRRTTTAKKQAADSTVTDESPKKTGRAKKGEKPSKRVSTVTSVKKNPLPPPPLPSQDDDSDRGAKRTRRTKTTEKTLDNVAKVTSVENDPSPPILQDDDSGMVDNGTMSGTSCAATFAQPPEPSTSKGFRKTRKTGRTTVRSSRLTNTNEDCHANGDDDNIPDPHAACDGLFEKKNSMAYEPLNDDNRHLLTGKSDLMENLNHVLILPGGEKPLHRTVKSSLGFVVMSGNALVQVGDKYSYVSTEDRFKVPIGEKYMIKNLSDEEPLKLLCIKV